MSRHEFEVAGVPGLMVVVGWDRGLQTYFGQVLKRDAGDEEDEVVFWVGTAPGEIDEVDELERLLRDRLPIDARLRACLEHDRAQAGAPTDDELAMMGLVGRCIQETRRTRVAGLSASVEGRALNPDLALFDLSEANRFRLGRSGWPTGGAGCGTSSPLSGPPGLTTEWGTKGIGGEGERAQGPSPLSSEEDVPAWPG
jgi:hypothetical protein